MCATSLFVIDYYVILQFSYDHLAIDSIDKPLLTPHPAKPPHLLFLMRILALAEAKH